MMPDNRPSVSSYNLFGAKITPATSNDIVLLLKDSIDRRRQCVVVYQNMHGLYVRLSDAAFDRLHQLQHTYVHIDGMPLVLLCRLRGIDASRSHRVTLVDHIWPLLRLAASERRRLYYLGSSDEVLRAGTSAMKKRFPNLTLRSHNGYFDLKDREQSDAVLRDIKAFRPDLILVGMGMGRQEHWILDNLDAVAPASICAVGACMEYLAGAVRTPPRWLGRIGLEWLFRLCERPGRIWYRYAVEPWFVLAHIVKYASTPGVDLPARFALDTQTPITSRLESVATRSDASTFALPAPGGAGHITVEQLAVIDATESPDEHEAVSAFGLV